MIPFLLLTLGQLSIQQNVQYVTPTELVATVALENPTQDTWNVKLYSGIGPPARPLACLPAPYAEHRGPDGVVYEYRFPLPGGHLAFHQARVEVQPPLGWAHVALVDATNQRTGAQVCEIRSAGPGVPGVPTLGGWALGALTLLLGSGLVYLRRK